MKNQLPGAKTWPPGVPSRPVKVAPLDRGPPPPTTVPVSTVCPQHQGKESTRDGRRSEEKYARAKLIGGE